MDQKTRHTKSFRNSWNVERWKGWRRWIIGRVFHTFFSIGFSLRPSVFLFFFSSASSLSSSSSDSTSYSFSSSSFLLYLTYVAKHATFDLTLRPDLQCSVGLLTIIALLFNSSLILVCPFPLAFFFPLPLTFPFP